MSTLRSASDIEAELREIAREMREDEIRLRVGASIKPWVDSRVVTRAFKDVQRQLVGGDNRKKTKKVLCAVQYVAQELGTGKLKWPELQGEWNKEHPNWRHAGRNGLYEAFHNFLRPKYSEPNFPQYDPEPWQEAAQAMRIEDWKKAEAFPDPHSQESIHERRGGGGGS